VSASIRCRRADSQETLRWLGGFTTLPRVTYLAHGEPGPMDALKATLESQLKLNVHAHAPSKWSGAELLR
jgi:metallo-beta-lactamase family protein